MRKSLSIVALSLLAATVAGCSADSGPSTRVKGNGDLTGELAKYNQAIVPLANTCTSTAGALACTVESDEIVVVSLRAVDLAVLVNGQTVDYADAKLGTVPLTTKTLKSVAVTGAAGSETTSETVILDVRNGLFALGAVTVDLKGNSTSNGVGVAGDEVAVLGMTGVDKINCMVNSSKDALDLNADKKADVIVEDYFLADNIAPNHFTVDLNAGDDVFDQGACTTVMAVYGSLGKDTITVGSLATGQGDVYSGGTDATATEPVDIITFANRTAGVTVNMVANTSAAGTSGNGGGLYEADWVLNDFETLTGTAKADVLNTGALLVGVAGDKPTAYTINGGAGDDVMSSKQNHGATFNGGDGVDTVTYAARTVEVSVSMDGKLADDGERDTGALTAATFDKIMTDVENLIGTDEATNGDKISANSANNVIKPGKGPDAILGLDGDDVMLSGAASGADAADGDDLFQGGTGTDTVDYSNRVSIGTKAVDIFLDATFSAATVAATMKTGTASGTAGSENDYVGVDVENAVGTIGADNITGSAVPNAVWSMGGADTIDGLAGIDQLDANVYTATLLTANGYMCGSTLNCVDGAGAALSPQPDDCDCKTPNGYRCAGVLASSCIDPTTNAAMADPGDCDCTVTAGGTETALTATCNPATGTALSATGVSVVDASCKAATYDAGTCAVSATPAIDCGGDSLDIATCAGGLANKFTGCWKTQT